MRLRVTGLEPVDLKHIGVEVDTPIDIELDTLHCKMLIDQLTEQYNDKLPGTVSIRLVGKLVVS